MPAAAEDGLSGREEGLAMPPPAPRPIARNYVWRLLSTDARAIVSFVFMLLGAIFTLVGAGLTIGIVTAFIGIPFAVLGLLFLASGSVLGRQRYGEMRKIVEVLRIGEATEGGITGVEQNYHVRINGRNPWRIRYRFSLGGRTFDGQVSTLNTPGAALQPGRKAFVLYLPGEPAVNSLYPHP